MHAVFTQTWARSAPDLGQNGPDLCKDGSDLGKDMRDLGQDGHILAWTGQIWARTDKTWARPGQDLGQDVTKSSIYMTGTKRALQYRRKQSVKHKKQTSFCCCCYSGFHALGDHQATDRIYKYIFDFSKIFTKFFRKVK